MSTKSLETLASVSARIRELAKRNDTEAVDEQHRLTEAVRQLASDLPRGRRAEFLSDEDVDTADVFAAAEERGGPVARIKAMHETPSAREEVQAAQRACDDLYILSTLLRKDGQRQDVRSTRYFKKL